MIIVFDILMISILVIFAGILVSVAIKYIISYNKFADYLFSINDQDTLCKIGKINILGKRTLANVPFTIVHKEVLKKYEETKDEKYLMFDELYMKYIKQLAVLAVFLFIAYSVYQIVKAGMR